MLKNRIDRAMVEMIAHVGEVTGKQTIAECAEDADTLAVLRDLGIHHAQGFAIARPRLFDADQVFVTRAAAMERMQPAGTVIPLRQVAG
jgi:EAL domain-containing protein (putative c-di-GMP-specific phosphodiesterase class I)